MDFISFAFWLDGISAVLVTALAGTFTGAVAWALSE